jgi:hypothetical protein
MTGLNPTSELQRYVHGKAAAKFFSKNFFHAQIRARDFSLREAGKASFGTAGARLKHDEQQAVELAPECRS